jgi:hypothetical protein
MAIRHWLDGRQPQEVARAINHSLSAVERFTIWAHVLRDRGCKAWIWQGEVVMFWVGFLD